jgi:NAD(P)-dependent dehydrogenase (short-subunit alcohol dehydrogenase family)
MDVTDWKAQEDIFRFAEKSFNKKIDIAIMIAGVLDSSDLINDCEQGDNLSRLKDICIKLTMRSYQIDGHYRTLEVNLTATAKFNRLAIQYFLKEKKEGCIINTSSIFGLGPAPTAPLYAASKHAVKYSF